MRRRCIHRSCEWFAGVAVSSSVLKRRAFSSTEFALTTPLILLQKRIHDSVDAVVPRETLVQHSRDSHVPEEAIESTLASLAAASIVVPINSGAYYHLKPSQLVSDVLEASDKHSNKEVSAAARACSLRRLGLVQSAQDNVEVAEAEFQALFKQLSGAIDAASRWRKAVWGGAMLFSGTQLAVISRLTYFDLDWDVMEPVSYFLGTGTSLVFFLYVLRYGRDHSYDDFDKTFVPKRVRKYAPSSFDWEAYDKAKDNLLRAHLELEKALEWAKRN